MTFLTTPVNSCSEVYYNTTYDEREGRKKKGGRREGLAVVINLFFPVACNLLNFCFTMTIFNILVKYIVHLYVRVSFILFYCLNGDNYPCVFIFQYNLVQLLEIALVDGMDKESDTMLHCSVNSLADLLSMVSGNCGGIDLHNHNKCSLQGIFVF